MAAAVFEAVEREPAFESVDVRVLPGITAMLAAAAASATHDTTQEEQAAEAPAMPGVQGDGDRLVRGETIARWHSVVAECELWVAAAEQAAGGIMFAAAEGDLPQVSGALRDLTQAALPYYEKLAAHRLTA